ncbi:histidine ammonia-lyase [Halalkalibacillus sediminis]|uniref:Histidine ammonia-lyase n=1 Tax=Halalkalibacillus sediminis TaxID=2018042 RepID=A0A2I0QSB8_9BACI|nr:histidine ammonia-lyase [Halalkalibacillus sediminis]PKR77208.1 histidine ammonia-lyase [Halalkalibacillus sediminis]
MVVLDGHHLTLEDIKKVAVLGEEVSYSEDSMEKVKQSRKTVEDAVENHEVVYGINTGFGKFSDVEIEREDIDELQLNLIHSHACGVGEPFSEPVTRAMIMLRANALLKGFSGVRPVLIERLIDLLNHQIHPVIPQQGSLGASGDLAPLSHLALALLGDGEVIYQGQKKPASEALHEEKLKPLELKAKEGLALINGTQAMTAVGALAYLEAESILKHSEKIAAMTIEGLEGVIDAFDELIHQARGYQDQIEVAERIRTYLKDSKLTTKQGEKRVQDAYSIRCIPQVLGASWQTLHYVKDKLDIEINAATDNPLIFSEEGKVLSGGNFHGQPIAIAMDLLKIGMSEVANISERRIERLVNPQLNDLPAFLSPQPGLQSGAMIMQYAAASLVSENKTLAHPASVDSIPSSANQEDHVSMGTIGARHASQVIDNVRRVISVEAICALQAVEIRGIEQMAPITKEYYETLREIVPSIKKDRVFSKDIEMMQDWLTQN